MMAKARKTRAQAPSRGSGIKRSVFVVLLVFVVALAWNWKAIEVRSLANAAVSARLACSCHYVSNRELGSCRQDIGSAARLAFLSADESETRVTAWIPLIVSQSAVFSEGQGCVLEPWMD